MRKFTCEKVSNPLRRSNTMQIIDVVVFISNPSERLNGKSALKSSPLSSITECLLILLVLLCPIRTLVCQLSDETWLHL